MTNTIKLRNKIEDSGLKYGYIAKKIGISRFALNKKINNESEFKSSEILIICEILGVESLDEKEAIFFAKQVDK